MLILIAESKTMEKNERVFTPDFYHLHTPAGEEEASVIMHRLSEMSTVEISSTVKISLKMATELKRMAYEFPLKEIGLTAMDAFTGVVFNNLDFSSLSPDDKEWAALNIRIISSLYGWLRPDDIIKPYRLDYSSPVSPDDTPLSSYWRSKVTIRLVKTIQEAGENTILDLLPGDAAKCIDWKLVKRFAKVWKVDFRQTDGENIRTPHAGRLKALRGKLLRNIITHRLNTLEKIKVFENDSLMPDPNPMYPDRISFLV